MRVDEFPRAGGFDHPGTVEEMMRFHEIMSEAGVPYLLAVTPRVALDYLNPDETPRAGAARRRGRGRLRASPPTA